MKQTLRQLSKVQFDRPKVMYRQITERVREMIHSGELIPGSKLPTTAALAKAWDTQVATVHAALTPLVKEGLLLRYPKKGTFVQERPHAITHIGMYNPMDIASAPGQDFKRSVHAALAGLLEAEGIALRILTDTRPESEHSKPLERLVRAADNREIQAVVAAGVGGDVLAWLTKLPIITSFYTTQPVPNRVAMDYEQAAELYVQALAAKGVRSIGLITHMEKVPSSPLSSSGDLFFQTFLGAAQRAGLVVRDEWIRGADHFVTELERWGYEQFHALWRLPNRPEGLAVFPGTSVRGVIMAALECQVKVPDQLHFAFHRNIESSILCPFPASWLESSGGEVAATLLEQVKRQFAGHPVRSTLLPVTLRVDGEKPV